LAGEKTSKKNGKVEEEFFKMAGCNLMYTVLVIYILTKHVAIN